MRVCKESSQKECCYNTKDIERVKNLQGPLLNDKTQQLSKNQLNLCLQILSLETFGTYTYFQQALGHFEKRTMVLILIMHSKEKLSSYAKLFL